MSDTDTDSNDTVSESLQMIHQHVEQLAHLSKHIYTRALRVHTVVEHPEIVDIWAQSFTIHERAKTWAKRNMVASKCSLWQVHETLLACAKKEGRLLDGKVRLTSTEATILDLSEDTHGIWAVLGRLPRFFM
jgi:hypothetical protein